MENLQPTSPSSFVSLVECPRDAMQGWAKFIPTETKIAYLNALLKVGFDTLDFGSFVSAKAIPQLADTASVIAQLDTDGSQTKLLAIAANVRGAEEASVYDKISSIGYPFSISPTFQQRNANSTVDQSFKRLEDIMRVCVTNHKELVVYISMAFGNPYGDAYSEKLVFDWIRQIAALGVTIISLADTVGLATPEQVFSLTRFITERFPDQQIGVHLHSTSMNWKEKTHAALEAGCRRFDGALKGIGGCPMAGNELVGNMDTGKMINYFDSLCVIQPLNEKALTESTRLADSIFS